MPSVSPADGPVAVTGASGYIGSWIVRDFAEQGYTVRACVRDLNKPDKVQHLLAMNGSVRGKVELCRGDLGDPGSYDAAFKGCCAVIHAGAAVGYNKETPQQVYDGCFTEVKHVLDSVKKAGGSVKRFVFTSSFAAVGHPRPEGYVYTERDWCGDNIEAYRGSWSEENIPKNRDIAYAMAKARAEKLAYETAAADGSFEALAILPLHVLGPLLCKNHDQPWSWQNCIKQMVMGSPYKKAKGGRMLWNNVDVRDVARAHRLCAEVAAAGNGSRFILAAADRSGELFTWQVQAALKELFPSIPVIGGEDMEDGKPKRKTYEAPRSYCLLAKDLLGLQPHPIKETLMDTVNSYMKLGLLEPRAKL